MPKKSKHIPRQIAVGLIGLLVMTIVGVALFDRSTVELEPVTPSATPTTRTQLEQTYTTATRFWAPTRTQEETNALATSVQEMVLTMTPRPTPTPAPTGTIESGPLVEANIPKEVDLGNIWRGYVDGLLTLVYAGNLQIYMYQPGATTDYGVVYIMQRQPDGSTSVTILTTETMPWPWTEPGYLRIMNDYTELGIMYLLLRGDNGNGMHYRLNLDNFTLETVGAPP